MVIDELFIALGIKADTNTLDKVNKGIKSIGVSFTVATAAIGGGIFALQKFVQGTLDSSVAMQNFNQQTGLSIEKLQQWQQAGQLSNLALSAEQVSSSIGGLQKNLAAIRMGQGNIAPFQLLGLDVGGDAFNVLDQLRSRVKNLDNQTATNLISQLGLSPEMLNVLKLSNEEFSKLSKNRFLSGQQQKDIISLGTSFKALTLSLKSIKDQAVAQIAPSLKGLVDNFFKWLNENGDKIISIVVKIAKGFGDFVQAIGNATTTVLDLISGLSEIPHIFTVISVGIGVLVAAIYPFYATLLLIIGILDDIAVWKQGGKSLIGSILGDYDKSLFGRKKKGEKITNGTPNFEKMLGVDFNSITGKTKPVDIGLPLLGKYINNKNSQVSTNNQNATNSTTNNIVMNVNGSSDPKQTANYAVQELQRIQLNYNSVPR